MIEPNYPIEVRCSPGIITSFGKKYAVAGQWIPIPDHVTMETLSQYVIYKRTEPEKPIKKYNVSSKKSKSKYVVEVWQNKITCSCSGYKWRAKCKHADAVKKVQKK